MKVNRARASKGIPVSFRLPREIISGLDAQADIITRATGNPTNRADVARIALTHGLAVMKAQNSEG